MCFSENVVPTPSSDLPVQSGKGTEKLDSITWYCRATNPQKWARCGVVKRGIDG